LYRCESKRVAEKGVCKAMKTQGIKIDEECGGTHSVRVRNSFGISIRRVFWWKSVDLLDSKGVGIFGEDRSVLGEVIRSANMANGII